jgi:hypothetical protein
MRSRTLSLASLLVACLFAASASSTSLPLAKTFGDGQTGEERALAFMTEVTGRDHTGARVSVVEVPSGSKLVATLVDGVLVPQAVPLNAVLPGQHPGSVADCQNAQVDFWWYTAYPVSTNFNYPFSPNVAPDCPYELQHGPVTFIEFHTAGDYWGATGAYDYTSGSYYELACAPAGTGYGAGYADQWVTVFKDVDLICYVIEYGLSPSQFTQWDAYVYNIGFIAETVYAAYA